ncbi:MAG: hypothetical protein Rhims3KO_36090 [Hyphomicrobiales bacterium]
MEEILDRIGKVCFPVEAVSGESRRFLGTAFAIGPRHLLTARHVLEVLRPRERATIVVSNRVGAVGRLRWNWPDDAVLDVALGQLLDGVDSFADWLTPMPEGVGANGTALTCFGYGPDKAGLLKWKDGISGKDSQYGLLSLQNTTKQGVSGGPVLTETGETVAIVIAKSNDGSQKYILPVVAFYRWIESEGWRHKISTEESGISIEDVSPEAVNLLHVPIGPPVRYAEIPRDVIDAFAYRFNTVATARNHIEHAMTLATKAHPGFKRPREISVSWIDVNPAPESMTLFWGEVFELVGKKSRRSVAALMDLEGAPRAEQLDAGTAIVLSNFRNWLTNPDQ